MDLISPYWTSDESSCGDSSGPSTPLCSPIVHPALVKGVEEAPLDQWLNLGKRASAVSNPQRNNSSLVSVENNQTADSIKTICFIGAGYVGGPTAAVIALHNPHIRVVVVDKDERRIAKWKSRHLPVYEPGLDDIVRISRTSSKVVHNHPVLADSENLPSAWDRQPNLFFTTEVAQSISKADVVFLAVNTSTKTFGVGSGRATDMSACDGAVNEIAIHAKSGTIIVEKSTVPCGTARRIREKLQSLRPTDSFEVLSNPEFLAEGSAIENLMNPDRVIIGSFETSSGRAAMERVASIYSAWVPRSRILTSNVWSSELAKLVANAMLAQRISSINAVSAICEETGADINEIAACIGKDSRIGPKFLKAGIGFGGSCFRKDIASLSYLAESLGLEDVAEYWNQVNKMNEVQHRRFARRVIKGLGNNLVGKKIAILGFAFKANTGDVRESLAVEIIKDLAIERPNEVAVFDPFCRKSDILRELEGMKGSDHTTITVCENPYEAAYQADALVIATDCNQFKFMRPENLANLAQRPLAAAPIPSPEAGVDITIFDSKLKYRPADMPPCVEGCADCATTSTSTSPEAPELKGQVDWRRLVSNLKIPRTVFDGRNVLDIKEIDSLGLEVRLECIGRRKGS